MQRVKGRVGLCRVKRGQQICTEEAFVIVGRSFGAAAGGKLKSAAAFLRQVTFHALRLEERGLKDTTGRDFT